MEENKTGNNLVEFLRLVQERTSQYTGSEELSALKAFIHGYLQGLFQNNIAEMSFPKYRWFSAWVKGRVDSELDLGYGWDDHIQSAGKLDKKSEVELFYELYMEFAESEVICYYQKLSEEKKIFRDAPNGPFWKSMIDSTTELLSFELLPSKSAWCLFLSEDKEILRTIVAENKRALIEKINAQYFSAPDNDWTQFDGSFYLKNLIISRPENNY